jgi:predicted small lipoprotein YifL
MILIVNLTADPSRFALRFVLLSATALLSAVLPGCGQTGPLYLPAAPAAAPAKSAAPASAVTTPAASAPASSVPASK